MYRRKLFRQLQVLCVYGSYSINIVAYCWAVHKWKYFRPKTISKCTKRAQFVKQKVLNEIERNGKKQNRMSLGKKLNNGGRKRLITNYVSSHRVVLFTYFLLLFCQFLYLRAVVHCITNFCSIFTLHVRELELNLRFRKLGFKCVLNK